MDCATIAVSSVNGLVEFAGSCGGDEGMFGDVFDERFETALSDGSVVELVPGGSEKAVTLSNVSEWAECVIATRLAESDLAMEYVKLGLSQVVPRHLLRMFTWEQVEILVCGDSLVDLDVLKASTVYLRLNAESTRVKAFWKALESFSQAELRLFLRFVSGRSRMGRRNGKLPQSLKIEAGSSKVDGLPKAATCFVQIHLPAWEDWEVAADRLRYAVRTCVSIDLA